MKLKVVRHAGLTVRNLERSIAFYRDVLGLELVALRDMDKSFNNDFVGRNVGMPGAHVKIAQLPWDR